ncbi:MAG: methyltransferase domain-containing protein, partial [Syntrophorhabdales bacterium]
IDDCLLFSPVAARIVAVIRDFAAKSGLRARDPNTGKGTLRRLVIREGKGTGEVMVNVIAETDISGHMGPLSKELPEAVAELRSLYAGSAHSPRLLWGRPYIEEILDDLSLRVYPFSFFQPNPKTAEALYGRMKAASEIRGDERVLGLYCGAGAIELFLARHVKEAKGIDSSAESIACARENAVLNGLKNVRFHRDRAETAVGRKEGGLKTIYEPKEIIPFDFFPQTSHFEVLAILEKQARPFHADPDRS